jgi:hypothetical protein
MADSSTNKLSKIKQKKKDVIEIEKSIGIPTEEKKATAENFPNGPVFEDVKTGKVNPQTSKSDGANASESVNESEQNNSILHKILFKLQLLLSMTNKIDLKMNLIFSQLLSEDHLKCILEERDCRRVCGNILCGNKLKKDNSKETYYYNNSVKDFRKENAMDFFCDVRCFQKFKDLTTVAQKFDFFRLLNIETIYVLSILVNYYPKNKYLDEISVLAISILNKEKKFVESGEFFQKIKEKYDKFFTESEEKESIDNEDIKIDSMFNN